MTKIKAVWQYLKEIDFLTRVMYFIAIFNAVVAGILGEVYGVAGWIFVGFLIFVAEEDRRLLEDYRKLVDLDTDIIHQQNDEIRKLKAEARVQ